MNPKTPRNPTSSTFRWIQSGLIISSVEEYFNPEIPSRHLDIQGAFELEKGPLASRNSRTGPAGLAGREGMDGQTVMIKR
ncbi:MAG: hypothetical protein JXL84_13305, partial [Deltaproteobacteria bacterium]|nr:hypothetical protein [Deltaproteobacteria bacterium]